MSSDIPIVELYYFTGIDCSVCKVLKPKIENLLTTDFSKIPLRTIYIEEEAVLSAQFSVFTLPVLLILVDGKEQFRFVRSFSVLEVQEKLQRLVDLIGT